MKKAVLNRQCIGRGSNSRSDIFNKKEIKKNISSASTLLAKTLKVNKITLKRFLRICRSESALNSKFRHLLTHTT